MNRSYRRTGAWATTGTRSATGEEAQRLGEGELAARAGIAPERLRRIERGTDGISLPALERLVTAMGHDMGVFVVRDGEDDARPKGGSTRSAFDGVDQGCLGNAPVASTSASAGAGSRANRGEEEVGWSHAEMG